MRVAIDPAICAAAAPVMALPVSPSPQSRFTAADAQEMAEAVIAVGPFMCECEFDVPETLARQAERLRKAGIALWVNSLDGVACAGMSDSLALGDADAIWGRLIANGVSVIQTDEPEAL